MRWIVPAAAAALFAGSASAQACNRADQTQTGMNLCAEADYKAADSRLNKTYGTIVARLKDDPEGRLRLRTAQRAWIAFRDAECEFVTASYEGGSMAPMVRYGCLTELTDEREDRLGMYLDCEEGDVSCSVAP